MDRPFSILGIDHVVLRARDPAVLERFYVDVVGCTLERRNEKARLTQLRAGRCLIDIVPADGTEPARPGNMDHLCLRIDPFDADAIARHLSAAGISPGPVVPRFGAEGDGPSVYLDDPEGNMLELKGPPG